MKLEGIIIIIGLLFFNAQVFSQETVTPNDVHDERVHAYAFINAHLFVDYQTQTYRGVDGNNTICVVVMFVEKNDFCLTYQSFVNNPIMVVILLTLK